MSDRQFRRFCAYGFLKNLRFFEAFLLIFLLDQRITLFQAGILYGLQAISINILEIPSGFMADAWGRRKVLAAGFGAYIASFLLFSFGGSYHWYVIAFILFGAGDALRTGVHKAMILQYLELNGILHLKVQYYGATRSWSQRGSAISAILAAGLIILHGDIRWVFLYSALPSLADLFLILSYPAYLDGYIGEGNQSPWERVKAVLKEFADTFRKPAILKATLNASMLTGFHQASKDYLQPLLQTMALSVPIAVGMNSNNRQALIIGIVYSLVFFASSFASRNSHRLAGNSSKAVNAMNYLLLIALVAGLLTGITFREGRAFIPVILFILIRLIVNLRRPISMSVLSEMYEKRSMASGMSAESQLQTLLTVILAPLLGWIADRWGLGTGLWAVSALLLLQLPFLWIRGVRKA